MKFVTFNIRCDYNQDERNNFCYRKDKIISKILSESPDVICFQEVLPHVARWLKETLGDYYVLGCGRDAALEDEQTAIVFKKTKYQLIAMNTVWLSPTPNVPGSRYAKQSICPRTCTEAVLQDVESKEVFRILNTHLDHEGSEARVLATQQILDYIQSVTLFKEAPVLLAGDLNAFPNDPEILLLTQNDRLIDVTEGLEGTFHEFGRLEVYEKIDYILVSKNLRWHKKGIWIDEEDGVYLSDHYPVFVEIDTK